MFKDLFETLNYDIAISTATHNSARFPFVSPAGWWKPAIQSPNENKKLTEKWHSRNDEPHTIKEYFGDETVKKQRLQDGGLFENYGAETALEILTHAKNYFVDEKKLPFNPIVIVISSDPKEPETFAEFPIKKPIRFGPKIRSTFRTFSSVRVGRGAEAAARLEAWTKSLKTDNKTKADFFHLRMCDDNKKSINPPLGWLLSKQAQNVIDNYLYDETECASSNMQSIKKIVAALPNEIKASLQ